MKRKTILRIAAVLVAVMGLSLLFAGCNDKKEEETDGSFQKILDKGQLVLGLDENFPPMGFTDGNGNIVGFDIDVAQEVCDRLGVELVKKPINWDKNEELLNSGEIDCIWNGMSVNDQRKKSMTLSDPYMKNEMIFVVKKNSSIKMMNDLSGKTVGVQSGSTAQELIKNSDLYTEMTLDAGDDNVALLKKMADGDIDAVFLDSIVAYYYISSNASDVYYVLPGNLGEEDYAVGFRKEDKTLRNKVQAVIDQMYAEGKMAEISRKWFGGDITTV